eukprot:s242_g27.t3
MSTQSTLALSSNGCLGKQSRSSKGDGRGFNEVVDVLSVPPRSGRLPCAGHGLRMCQARALLPPALKWIALHTLLAVPILAMRVQRVHKNPVTRVTDLLERLKDKVEKQGADEAKLWEKMQCNCKKTTTNLQKNIEQEETRLPMLRSDHSALGAQKARLVAEKERAVADRKDAQTALSSAEELRQQEATDYTKLKEETNKNLAAIGKAIAAIEKGLSGHFLQTDEAEELRQVVSTANLRLSDRDALAALLAGEMPQSSSIVGEHAGFHGRGPELSRKSGSRSQERLRWHGHGKAKSDLYLGIRDRSQDFQEIGELSVDMVNKQQAIDSSAKKLQDRPGDDGKLLADTKETCDQQEEDWQARSQSRADEMHAIQETLSLLGDDQAGQGTRVRALAKAGAFCGFKSVHPRHTLAAMGGHHSSTTEKCSEINVPMWVVKISDFLSFSDWPSHEELKKQGTARHRPTLF